MGGARLGNPQSAPLNCGIWAPCPTKGHVFGLLKPIIGADDRIARIGGCPSKVLVVGGRAGGNTNDGACSICEEEHVDCLALNKVTKETKVDQEINGVK